MNILDWVSLGISVSSMCLSLLAIRASIKLEVWMETLKQERQRAMKEREQT